MIFYCIEIFERRWLLLYISSFALLSQIEDKATHCNEICREAHLLGLLPAVLLLMKEEHSGYHCISMLQLGGR